MSATTLGGKVAIVTGAGRGIGRAIALAYAQAGAAVACAARSEPEIAGTAREIEARGGLALALATDVTQAGQVRRLVDTVAEHFGGLDILVINAGASTGRQTVEEGDPEAWRQTLDINLLGAYYSAQAAIPHLKRRGTGKIIAVGSGMGHNGRAGGSAYACSKAGLWMLTRVLAQELWPYRISVNELVPGPVETAMTGGTGFPDSEWIKQPEDVVPLALFLATQPDIGPTAQSFSLMRRDG